MFVFMFCGTMAVLGMFVVPELLTDWSGWSWWLCELVGIPLGVAVGLGIGLALGVALEAGFQGLARLLGLGEAAGRE